MKLFRGDPDDSLRAAQQALAQAEDRIQHLAAERDRALAEAEGDYVAAVAKIDRELLSQQANAGVHRDRIVIMEQRSREAEQARREASKAAAIADRKKAVQPWRAAAARVDAAVAALAEAVAALDAADAAVFTGWPDILPPQHHLSFLSVRTVDALSARRRKPPMMAGLIRELITRDPIELARLVDNNAAELLQSLEAAAVPVAPSELAA